MAKKRTKVYKTEKNRKSVCMFKKIYINNILKSVVYKRVDSVPGFYFMCAHLILCQYLICALDNQLWREQDI